MRQRHRSVRSKAARGAVQQPDASDIKSFDSAKEAFAYAASLMSTKTGTRDYFIFRGESRLYKTMLPSLYRRSTDKFTLLCYTTLLYSLAMHFWNDYLEPSLGHGGEGVYYKGKPFVNLPEISEVRSAPSGTDVDEAFQGLFQHYGWPTHWLDITFDPKVAFFCLIRL
jgi:hypothetical protein